MKTIAKLGVVALLLIAVLFSCKKAESLNEEAMANTQSSDSISSSAAVERKGETQKFIRTADLKFKVKNVAKSTYTIENTVNTFGGYVTYTNLQSTVNERIETKISQDSILETTKYAVENNITIRVPNTQLDTVIKTIAKQIDFLDYRVIKADDVSLKLLSNQYAQKRSGFIERRIEKAIDEKGKKINDIIDAETNLASQKEQNDNQKIENLSLQDQVSFSTLTLVLYQRDSIKREIVANEKDKYSFQPNMGLQIVDALKGGWYILQETIVFLIQLWWLFVLSSIGFFVYRKYFKNKT
ncbi:DUF4349 domain-containing protein [Flavobacterium psychrotolerans]|uniref:DUF4349 domain-containing protein n=1 Tax=Flavobacterium psychrotolerans TaxID=2169410 RepID=A0A2U1JG47_9FLAO|nr:DUF4349 domain-containing protein [Flavobacterium psychrotolerans]PWA04005.1 DUF4349 domain-containing protein [Flavobacterium psychrotolerans]